jgi:hypothetical protein
MALSKYTNLINLSLPADGQMLQSVCETKVVATSSPAEPKLVISSYGINIGMVDK